MLQKIQVVLFRTFNERQPSYEVFISGFMLIYCKWHMFHQAYEGSSLSCSCFSLSFLIQPNILIEIMKFYSNCFFKKKIFAIYKLQQFIWFNFKSSVSWSSMPNQPHNYWPYHDNQSLFLQKQYIVISLKCSVVVSSR